MSQRGDRMDGPPVERPQTSDRRQTHRLYPSLPSTDRSQACAAADPSRGGSHPDGRIQSDSDIRMEAQILLLEEQRQELLSINEKWAKEYRTMVRYYKERVQGLKASLQRIHTEEEEKEEKEEEGGTNAALCVKVAEGQNGDRLLKVEKEAEELRAQTGTLTRRGQRQREEIRRLNRALEDALRPPRPPRPPAVSADTLQDVWKHQAEVYKEDFLKERSDRVKLKEKYLEQEKKFRKVQSQLLWTPTAPRPTLKDRAACARCETVRRALGDEP